MAGEGAGEATVGGSGVKACRRRKMRRKKRRGRQLWVTHPVGQSGLRGQGHALAIGGALLVASPRARGGGLTPRDGGSELPLSTLAFYGTPRAEESQQLRLIRASRAKGGLKMAA